MIKYPFLVFLLGILASVLAIATDYKWLESPSGVEWSSPSSFCVQHIAGLGLPSNYTYAGPVARSSGTLFGCGASDSNRGGQIFEWGLIARSGSSCSEGLTYIAETGQCVDKKDSCDARTDGNPVVILEGKKVQNEIDYDSNGGVLTFMRRYNQAPKWSDSLNEWVENGDWYFDYAAPKFDRAVEYVSDKALGEVSAIRLFLRPNGEYLKFTGDQSTGFVSDPDQDVSLTVVTDAQLVEHWQLTLPDDSVETYSMADGALESIRYKDGNEIQLTYSSNTTTVTETTSGDTITLIYTNGQITKMVDPDQNEYIYGYNGDQLVTVTYPDEDSDPANNPVRTYHYENTNPTLLTGITDERNIRFATWDYDSEGRAILSKHESPTAVGGVDKVEFDYDHSRDFNYPHITVTNALGHESKYYYAEINGVRKLTRVERPLHANANNNLITCQAADQYTNHDANGYKDKVVDWQGNAVDYDYDAEGQEERREEGLSATATVTSITTTPNPETRVITTKWHPDFRLPTRVTEPGRVTDTSYDCDTGRVVSHTVYELANAPAYSAPSCSGS